jgi:type IX secretion system PorP/SprF family membrane protein
MRKIYLFLLTLGVFGAASAQQIPLFTQYYYNPFLLNPALAGSQVLPNVVLGHRIQWTGIEGAPQTTVFSGDMLFQKARSGVGLNLINDQIHYTNRVQAQLAYAYHLKLGRKFMLSFGASGGFTSLSINTQQAYASGRILDNGDPLLSANSRMNSGLVFDVTAGADLRMGNLHIGLVAPQMLNNQVKVAGVASSLDTAHTMNLATHYTAYLRYNFHLRSMQSVLTPLLQVRRSPFFNKPQIDMGLIYTYDHKIWGAVSYRQDYATTVGLGTFIGHNFKVGYSIDLPLSKESRYLGLTHEIMLGMRFGRTDSKDYLAALEDFEPDGNYPVVLAVHPKFHDRHKKHRMRHGSRTDGSHSHAKSREERRHEGQHHWWQFWHHDVYRGRRPSKAK